MKMTTTKDSCASKTPTDQPNKILCWGANSYGQLSLGNKDDQLEPIPIANLQDTNILYITGGGGHSLAITDENKLLVCGSNSRGQLGLGHTEDITVLTSLPEFHNKPINQVVGGWDFTLAVSGQPQGDVLYSWGSNSFNQLGRSSQPNNFSPIPGIISLPSGTKNVKIKNVTAGLRHCMVLTEQGCVFTWGHGKKGQLGYLLPDKSAPKSVQQPTKVELPEPIIKIFCGSYYSGAVSEQGNLYLWGCNKYGQLAHDVTILTSSSLPIQISSHIFKTGIKQITSGWTHILVLTDDGNVYSWGRGDYGQLGRKISRICDFTPSRIDNMQPIQYITCGSEHNLAIDSSGNLLSWGWNEHGICGTGDEINIYKPSVPNKLIGINVRHIGCGAGHSFAVVEET
ncbi:secretion-regulating guanine nucleotide exchange factor [Patella vulgata]|uniref:secretion-regulating guanine nucleotide exchange factor n=1 Tax=Patella vulgata TaxID=6465 RepID=UPI00218032D4|nr:secretion-regulating guanine nucleotide exchange factor [Patella vulgata]